VTIDLYLDFQCPACAHYEQQAGATIDELVASGRARVVYHPVAYLNRYSSTQYSSRSSAAAGCAADAGVLPRFAQLLYANQPPEGGDGLPDEQLVALGTQAGAGPGFTTCVQDGRYADWTRSVTDAASRVGITATPTVLVNGREVERTAEALRAAVAAG
jgi:protein-disulfide isomerase